MFDGELDGVELIEHCQTFTACLFRYSKKTRMDHDIPEAVVATYPFSVSSDRLIEIFGDEPILGSGS